jgi:hypothetical protein
VPAPGLKPLTLGQEVIVLQPNYRCCDRTQNLDIGIVSQLLYHQATSAGKVV